MPKKFEVTHVERGWIAHFICADKCLFRRNTLIECEQTETRIIVSTVGAMRVETLDRVYFAEISPGRFYETVAFHAHWDGIYWDADVSKKIINIDSPWNIDTCERETDEQANKMHDDIVTEIYSKMLEGEKYKNVRKKQRVR